MKNILKKLGVIGLAIAVLTPFIDLPVVKADDGECEYHLQSFLFLDAEKGVPEVYENRGYTTLTTFPWMFSNYDAETTTVTKAYVEDFVNDSSLLTDFYADAYNLSKSTFNDYREAPAKGNYYVSSNGDYKEKIALLHGYWAKLDDKGNEIQSDEPTEQNWSDYLDSKNNSYQKSVLSSGMKTSISGARFEGGSGSKFFQLSSTNNDIVSGSLSHGESESGTANVIIKYFNYIIKNKEDAADKDYIYPGTDGKMYVNLSINRLLDDETLNSKYYGLSDTNGDLKCIFSSESNEVKDSYDTYSTYRSSSDTEEDRASCYSALATDENKSNTIKVDPNNWWYWPTVLSVEYKTCSNETATEGKWNLKYDKNTTESVSNMPSDSSDIVLNTKVKVAKGPTLTGKAFTGWCTDKEGKSSCYKADQEITSTTSTTITLYAQWGAEGTTDNNKTGVVSYIIGFLSVGAIAGGIYLVSKKKNLFKQI